MPRREEILALDRRGLAQALAAGYAIDPARLDDTEYRGISLGLPRWMERLSWKTFQKTFHRDPATGHLRGWNVRVEQRGLDAASVALQRRGQPFCWGHYQVVTLEGQRPPRASGPGLCIDYGLGRNSRFSMLRFMRDPLVALDAGSVELLLGWSYLDFGIFRLSTPSYFLLERERPLAHIVPPPR